MKISFIAMLCLLFINACVVIPVKDELHTNMCEISSDRKTLKIVDIAKETNSYYSISGIVLTPILIPATTLVSGTYVLVNNSFRLGEETIMCESKVQNSV